MTIRSAFLSRVLFITHAYPDYPGAFRGHLVQRIAWGLRERGILVDVLCPRVFRQSPLDEIDSHGVHISRFVYPSGGKILLSFERIPFLRMVFFYLSALFKALDLLKAIRYDLIHAHWIVPLGPLAIIAGGLFHIPVVSHAHGSDVHTYTSKNMLTKSLAWFTVRNSKNVIVVSSELGDTLSRLCSVSTNRIRFLPPFVDTRMFCPQEGNSSSGSESVFATSKNLLFAGGLLKNKGILPLLDAAGKFLPLRPDLHLTFLGDGPLKENIQDWINEQGLEKQVTLAGNVPHTSIPGYMRNAFALLLPSLQEGTPSVLLEALACGLPVIASAVGGIPDLIDHMKNGLLLSPGSAEDINDAVISLLENKQIYLRLRRNARQSTMLYGREAGIDGLIDIYNSAMRI
jgi:glycosyltransferase involved in cell wall biosynthesis